MHSVDGWLELIRAELVAAKAAADDLFSLPDQTPVPDCPILLAEQYERAIARVRDERRDSVSNNSAKRPATSGSSGMSFTRIRASLIASTQRSTSTELVRPAL